MPMHCKELRQLCLVDHWSLGQSATPMHAAMVLHVSGAERIRFRGAVPSFVTLPMINMRASCVCGWLSGQIIFSPFLKKK